MEIFTNWHRFSYLFPGFKHDWHFNHAVRVEKTMLWEDASKQIWWEFHDGLRDTVEHLESTQRLELVLNAADFNKRVFYVKPNLSLSKSANFYKLCAEKNVILLTCMPWSYYEPYKVIYHNRHMLRRQRVVGDTDLFAGNPHHDGRLEWCQSVSDNFVFKNGLNTNEYIEEVLKARRTLQPLGISLRGSMYESIALGVPFVVQECSYLKPIFRENAHDGQALIDIYETQMLPNQIIDDVLQQVNQHV